MGNALRIIGYGLVVAISISFASAQTPSSQTPQVTFAATSAHVAQPGSPINIKIFRWSTDEERASLVAVLNTPPPPPPPPVIAAPAPVPDADAAPPAPDQSNAGRAGRAGRGGGRDGRGRAAAPPPPPKPITPIEAFTNSIAKAPTVGYIWTDEVTGYSIKYAYRVPQPGGGERIVLATNRVLGGGSIQWKPTEPTTDYEFTIIELRLNAKGLGEGKTSLTSKIFVENDVTTFAIENYAAAPVILQNVKKG